jgi:serine/threonine-protein kinase RsbW
VIGPTPLYRSTEIDASLESLRPLGTWLLGTARDAGLPEEAAAGLDHALHEAVENVVRYAWPDPAGHRIRVAFRCDGTRAEVEVEDDGCPFDPLQVPAPEPPVRLEDLVPGGYGVPVMRHFTDEVLYRREGRYNRLTLRRRLAGSAER